MDFSFGGNWIDLIFLGMLIYFVITNSGFILTSVEIAGFLLSLLVSYYLYPYIAEFFINNFSVLPGYANVLGFFTIWIIFEGIYFVVTNRFIRFKSLPNKKMDGFLGLVMGAFQALVVFTLFVSLIFALPVRGDVKKAVLDSNTGSHFVSVSRAFETHLKSVFGKAAQETLNFLTIKPDSTSSVDLGFKGQNENLAIDPESEEMLISLVNDERQKIGLPRLEVNVSLRDVSREYARQMLEFGFFSHVSVVDGSDAGERATSAGVSYGILGENLAYAPDVYIAHQGLMNSEGHRKNILFTDYRAIGIGVVDAGIYGKMFVQLFSD